MKKMKKVNVMKGQEERIRNRKRKRKIYGDEPSLYNLLKYEDFLVCLNSSVPVTVLTVLMT